MLKKRDIICGVRPLEEALKNNVHIIKVLWRKGMKNPASKPLISALRSRAIPVQKVPEEKLNRLAGSNHQGIVAMISPVEFIALEQIIPSVYERGENPFIVLLDGVTDVHNFGAVARTAECCGVHAIVIPEKGSAMPGKDAVKSSSGALLRIPVCRVPSLIRSVHFLKDSGLHIAAITEKADLFIYDHKLTPPLALLFGSERKGIDDTLLKHSHISLSIPMYGKTGSMNVSVAAGIAMYEANRQRTASETFHPR